MTILSSHRILALDRLCALTSFPSSPFIGTFLNHPSDLNPNNDNNNTNNDNKYPHRMKLTDLPSEILLDIISCIELNSDLAKVTLVSHRFNDLAEPHLYRKIHLHAEPLENYQAGFLPTLKRTDQLIASLKARPELGAYTTAFSLRVTDPLWYLSYPQLSIIKRMPRLRQLSYDPPAFHGGGRLAENKELAALRLDFSHVTNHYIVEDRGLSWLELGVPLQIIAKKLWQPSLRKLQAEKLYFTDELEPGPWLVGQRMRVGSAPVEDLRFLDCCPRMDVGNLTAFINAVRHLKCFVLEINSPWDPLVEPDTSAPKTDIGPAMLAHRGTIEELAISTTEHALYSSNIMHAIGSLTQWTALKRLAIPEAMLSEPPFYQVKLHQVLPPQLEELQLYMKFSAFSAQELEMDLVIMEEDLRLFKELATNKQACVPGLKRVICWLQHPSPGELGDDTNSIRLPGVELDALELVFRKVNVQFEWVSTALFKDTPVGKRLYEW